MTSRAQPLTGSSRVKQSTGWTWRGGTDAVMPATAIAASAAAATVVSLERPFCRRTWSVTVIEPDQFLESMTNTPPGPTTT
jgi:hypothetical protein